MSRNMEKAHDWTDGEASWKVPQIYGFISELLNAVQSFLPEHYSMFVNSKRGGMMVLDEGGSAPRMYHVPVVV